MAKLMLILSLPLLCLGLLDAAPRYRRDEDCLSAIDIIFVLDESGSIYYLDFEKQLEFVNDYVDRFDTSPNVTHVGVMTFANDAKTHIPLSMHPDKKALKQLVESIGQRRGQTMTNLALDHMTRMMTSNSRSWVPHVAVVITDGDPDNEAATARAAARAHAAGITTVAIGVGLLNVGRDVLHSIASNDDFVYHIDNYEGLDRIVLSLTKDICEITTAPPPTTTTTTLPMLISGCRSRAALDIAFALPDFIGATDNSIAVNFVNELVEEFEMGPTQVQAAITPRYCYDDEPIFLDQYDRVDMFRTELLERRYITGAATHFHVNHLVNETFSQTKGAREGSIKVAILIVEEDSNDDDLPFLVEAAKENDIHLIVVGVGDRVSDEELNMISSSPCDVFKVANYDELATIQADIVTRLCGVAMGL